ncbi:MAG TPA: nucleotidyltransferase [Terriglobales bacterium]|nr:nucleotidyltransferase [Terriglobales bacterium]
MSPLAKPLPVSSSEPPQFAPEQEQLFRDVLLLLNDRHIPYVVSGAFALHEHTGIWRDTKDLDLFMSPDQIAPVMEILQEHGFETEICDPVWLCKARQGEYFVDLISGMSNAIIRVDQSWIERGFDSHILGIPAKVLAPEELIASKIFVAFRERFGGADIAHLVYAAGTSMDWNRLLSLVHDHWEMLLWSLVLFHYIYPSSNAVPKPVWDELLAKFRAEIDNPDASAPFRGSLVDEKMFSIDTREWKLRDMLAEYREQAEPKIREVTKPAA